MGYLVKCLASFPGVPVPNWRRDEEDDWCTLPYACVLISEKFRKMGYPGKFLCNSDVKIVEFLQPQ